MNLDFSKLNNLASAKKTPPQTPIDGAKGARLTTDMEKTKNAPEDENGDAMGKGDLKRKKNLRQAEKSQNKQIFKGYQEAIKQSELLQCDILKGVKEGENIYSLFLKACKVISVINSNKVFYEQAQEDIKAIYGAGLAEPAAAEIFEAEVKARLDKLEQAVKGDLDEAEKSRIKTAIAQHRKKIETLKNK